MNNPETIKITCLSVEPAMAYAIAYLGKDIENRSWRADYTGPLYIHASKSKTHNALYQQMLAEMGLTCPDFENLSKGCLLCRVWVERVEQYKAGPDDYTRWGMPGQYWWRVKEPEVFVNPVPAKGKLGLFKIEVPVSDLKFVGFGDERLVWR